jgi:hypothetical protein
MIEMEERRREQYTTALAQAHGIVPECLALFEHWREGQTVADLFKEAQSLSILSCDSNRRLRNIVFEGFGSRFLRDPHTGAAPFLKRLFASAPPRLSLEIILLYTLRQHAIFFDFMREIYWPAIRAGRQGIDSTEIFSLIDRGRIDGKLGNDWRESVRKRVSGDVLGVAHDFELVGRAVRGHRPLLQWMPSEGILLYLAYDLHFLELSDDQMVSADEWSAFGLERSDVVAYLNRLAQRGHFIVQDSGVFCRVDWNYSDRSQLNDAFLRG